VGPARYDRYVQRTARARRRRTHAYELVDRRIERGKFTLASHINYLVRYMYYGGGGGGGGRKGELGAGILFMSPTRAGMNRPARLRAVRSTIHQANDKRSCCPTSQPRRDSSVPNNHHSYYGSR
jgi:hypothetical protein